MFNFVILSRKRFHSILSAHQNAATDLSWVCNFLNSLVEGSDQNLHSQPGNTVLLQSAIRLQESIAAQSKQEHNRQWESDGLANFIEILKRSSEKTLKQICDETISYLVRYMKANQGAVFLLNSENKDNLFFELMGIYAYDKKRYVSKRVGLGEGLVGECFSEGNYIYLTDVPKSFVKITSGLGEATPTSIILLPLVSNSTKIGVVEIALFRKLQKFEIDFLVKVSESIAGLIVRKRDSEATLRLLDNAQAMSAKLAAQEEELQQNIEELNATQEEVTRQNKELERAKRDLLLKNQELEIQREREAELLESKLATQNSINDTIVTRLKTKIHALEAKVASLQAEEELLQDRVATQNIIMDIIIGKLKARIKTLEEQVALLHRGFQRQQQPGDTA
jgi:hypothetical protein